MKTHAVELASGELFGRDAERDADLSAPLRGGAGGSEISSSSDPRAGLDFSSRNLDRAEVPVGVIIVHREKGILAEAFNETNVERNGTRHAEMVAFDDILMRQNLPASILEECDLFVTCEVT